MSNLQRPSPSTEGHHGEMLPVTNVPYPKRSWRGVQIEAEKVEQREWASRLQTSTFNCRLCGWVSSFSGMAYDELMHVCQQCAFRLNNLYQRKHSGAWFYKPSATDDDLSYFSDNRYDPEPPRPPRQKANIKLDLRLQVYERDGFKCVYCSAKRNLTLDHVTAESKGGATAAGNLVTCCKTCNSRKRTKTLADFWEASQ